MPSMQDYIPIKEAARILGVSTKTLRSWDKAGKLKAKRHPLNNYRLYSKAEVDTLIQQITGEK